MDIDGYAAFYMGGIADLNDALGGVTLTVQSDYPFTNLPGCSNLVSGREVTRETRISSKTFTGTVAGVPSRTVSPVAETSRMPSSE